MVKYDTWKVVADFYGSIIDVNGDKVDRVGFVWDTSSHSQPSDGTEIQNTPYSHNIGKIYEDGWGNGDSFQIHKEDPEGGDSLKTGTTYYIRAYAKNSEGYSYSSTELSFTTPTRVTESTGVNVTGSVLSLDTFNRKTISLSQVNASSSLTISETTKTNPMKRVNIEGSGNVNITETVRTNEKTTIQALANVPGINEYSNILELDLITASSNVSGSETGGLTASFEKVNVLESISIVETGTVIDNPTLIEVNSTLNTISDISQVKESTGIDILSNISIIEESKSVESTNILINFNTDIDVDTEVFESSLITASASLLTLSEVSTGEENTQINIQGYMDITELGRSIESALIKPIANIGPITEKGFGDEETLINIIANVPTLDDVPTVEDVLKLYAEVTTVVQFDREITNPIRLERDID